MNRPVLALRLPDGRLVRADPPPARVLRALRRRTLRDLQVVVAWLEDQERRYPTQPERSAGDRRMSGLL